jgi:hypothetical protein
VAVQLPSLSIVFARALYTHNAMESLRVGIAVTEILYSRNKLGVDVNIIAVV